MVPLFRKKHEACDDIIASLRKQISDFEPKIEFSKRQGAQRAAPGIQFSSRPSPAQTPVDTRPLVGVGLMIKDEGPGRMRVTQVARGGGAANSGQINVGDLIVGIAPTPDEPLQVPQVTACTTNPRICMGETNLTRFA